MSGISPDTLVEKYLAMREQVKAIEDEAKEKTSVLKAKMDKIETYFLALAERDGLKNIPTHHGLVYFGVSDSATLADPSIFMEFVVENQAWDLLEKRASSTATRSFVEENGHLPPGVNFTSRRRVTVRRGK